MKQVPFFISRGNFRPIGRSLDYIEHSAAYQLAIVTKIPVNVVHGMFRILAAALLGWLALVLARQYFAPQSKAARFLTLLTPFAFAAHLVAAGASGPPLLFPWLYMVTTGVGFSLALLLGNAIEKEWRVTPAVSFAFFGIGAALAATNEIASVGIGIGLSHAILLSWAKKRSLVPALRLWAIAALGFAAVFIPSRMAIADACKANACYAASNLGLETWSMELFLTRIVSGSLPVAWTAAERASGSPLSFQAIAGFLFGYGGIILGVAVAVVIGLRRYLFIQKFSVGMRSSRRSFAFALVFGVSVVLGGALMASLSTGLQVSNHPLGFVWRDSGFAFVGWTIVLATLMSAGLAWITRKGRYRMAEGFAYITLIGVLSITMLLNSAVARRYNAGSEALLNNQIAASMSSWDVSEYGVAYRCRLLNEWSEVYVDQQREFRPAQLEAALDSASLRTYGQRYCEET